MQPEPAVNPIHPVVITLCLIIVGIEMMFTAAGAGIIGGKTGIGWRLFAIQDFAFSPFVLDRVIGYGEWGFAITKRFVTYGFIHGDFVNALFAAALMLALGKFVGDVYSTPAVLVVIFGSLIFGALIFGLMVDGNAPLFGIYPAIYGLIGAYTYILWIVLGSRGESQIAAFRLIGFLLALQLVFSLIFGGNDLWIAEIAGFAFGFMISIIVAPGGWAALLAKLRQRS